MAADTIKQVQGSEQTSSRAYLNQQVGLNSLQAQKILKRSYSRLSDALFSSSVVLRTKCTREEADGVEEIINEHFDKVQAELEQEKAKLTALMENNAIQVSPDYSNRGVYDVQIKSPKDAVFLHLIGEVDTIISMLDTLWMTSVISDSQRSDTTFQWQQRLIKMASRVMAIEKSARIKANKRQQEQKKEVGENAQTEGEVKQGEVESESQGEEAAQTDSSDQEESAA